MQDWFILSQRFVGCGNWPLRLIPVPLLELLYLSPLALSLVISRFSIHTSTCGAVTPICTHIMNALSDTRNRVLVTGTPGIGKSVFGFYLILRLLHLRETFILYHSTKDQLRVLFRNGRIFRGNLQSFDEEARHEAIIIIYDCADPLPVLTYRAVRTIALSSPRQHHYNDFGKTAMFFYMPPWEWEEVAILAQSLQKTREEIVACYKLFLHVGGIPRHLFESSGWDKLKEALQSVNPEAVFSVVATDSVLVPEKANIVIHLIPTPDFRHCSRRLATQYVAHTLTDRFRQTCIQQLRAFIYGAKAAPTAQGLAGDLYEPVVFEQLRKGGQFPSRGLYPPQLMPSTTEFKFDHELEFSPPPPSSSSSSAPPPPPASRKRKRSFGIPFTTITVDEEIISSVPRVSHRFHHIEEVKEKPENFFLFPAFRNLAGADALVRPNILFQITVGDIHPINYEGLQTARNVLGLKDVDVCKLYFVVPDSVFNTFSLQPYAFPKKGETCKCHLKHTSQCIECAKADSRVEQHVICLDVTPGPPQAIHP
jgi:hypothetical protein